MDREIEFRGRAKDDGQWIYGDYARDSFDNPCINATAFNGDKYLYEVDPDTVGQYTGLIDKNGRKIFEGDRVKGISGGFPISGVVFYDNECAAYRVKHDTADHPLTVSFLMDFEELTLEIIGTIYDTPELLAEGEKG